MSNEYNPHLDKLVPISKNANDKFISSIQNDEIAMVSIKNSVHMLHKLNLINPNLGTKKLNVKVADRPTRTATPRNKEIRIAEDDLVIKYDIITGPKDKTFKYKRDTAATVNMIGFWTNFKGDILAYSEFSPSSVGTFFVDKHGNDLCTTTKREISAKAETVLIAQIVVITNPILVMDINPDIASGASNLQSKSTRFARELRIDKCSLSSEITKIQSFSTTICVARLLNLKTTENTTTIQNELFSEV